MSIEAKIGDVKDDEFAERLRVLAAENAARGAKEFANAMIDAFRRMAFVHKNDLVVEKFTALQMIDILKLARDDIKQPLESGV